MSEIHSIEKNRRIKLEKSRQRNVYGVSLPRYKYGQGSRFDIVMWSILP